MKQQQANDAAVTNETMKARIPAVITYHRVILGALTREGNALAEIVENGDNGQQLVRTLAIPAGLPGEEVTIAVETRARVAPKRHRRRWKARPPRAWITEIHRPSAQRVAARCPVFGECGGCQLQHMDYAAQLAWKRAVVARLLKDIGGFDDPPVLEPVPCANPWNYRNHMRFSVNRAGQPGLTATGSHRVLPLESCPIAHEQINRALGSAERRSKRAATGADTLRRSDRADAHSATARSGRRAAASGGRAGPARARRWRKNWRGRSSAFVQAPSSRPTPPRLNR